MCESTPHTLLRSRTGLVNIYFAARGSRLSEGWQLATGNRQLI